MRLLDVHRAPIGVIILLMAALIAACDPQPPTPVLVDPPPVLEAAAVYRAPFRNSYFNRHRTSWNVVVEPGRGEAFRVSGGVSSGGRIEIPICYLGYGEQIVLIRYEYRPLLHRGEMQFNGVAEFPRPVRTHSESELWCREKSPSETLPLFESSR